MSNWHRREVDVKRPPAPGNFAITAAFSDLMVIGVGDHDGIISGTAAMARSMAWIRHAPMASVREHRDDGGARMRVDVFAPVPSPERVQRAWRAFVDERTVGEALIMRTPENVSKAFSGSTDRVPEGRPIPGAGVAEIYVRFRDWQIYYQPCKTGMVATARIAAWLSRYPLARVRETNGHVLLILIEIDEVCPDELKAVEQV